MSERVVLLPEAHLKQAAVVKHIQALGYNKQASLIELSHAVSISSFISYGQMLCAGCTCLRASCYGIIEGCRNAIR